MINHLRAITRTGLLLFAGVVIAAEKPVNQTRAGVAIKGYDPVAYFTQSEPVKGSKDHAFQWNGAAWYFANAENLMRFQENPEKFAPKFGGYCAYAVSLGKTANIDPKAWKIVDGKLYLNYSRSIQKKWEADIPGYIAKAEENWPEVLQ